MSKVWIVEECYEYEGCNVESAWATELLARERAALLEAEEGMFSTFYTNVTEMEVRCE